MRSWVSGEMTGSVSQWYVRFMATGDPRVKNWPLMQSPFPVTAIILGYILVVKYVGPHLMKNKKPFDLRYIIAVYNLILVAGNLWLFIRGGIYGWFGKYNFICQPVDYSMSPDGIGMATTAWYFFISKLVELLDTLFFVLRKKQSQVTTLHVVHHSLLPFTMWWGIKFVPGGHGSFLGFINSFVHVIMYTYYLLSALGPRVAPYLWWKKYLTTLQLTQFGLIFGHTIQLLLIECDYPHGLAYPMLLVTLYFVYMFVDFYRKAYIKRSVKSTGEMSQVMPTKEEGDQTRSEFKGFINNRIRKNMEKEKVICT